MKKVRRIISW